MRNRIKRQTIASNRKVVAYLPVKNYKPSLNENKVFADYCRLLGYHFKWSFERACPMIFSPDHKRLVFINKDNNLFGIYGAKKEMLMITSTMNTIIKQAKQRVDMAIIREVYGIHLFN